MNLLWQRDYSAPPPAREAFSPNGAFQKQNALKQSANKIARIIRAAMNNARVNDMRSALASPEMRRVLGRILRQSNLLRPAYAPGDALATAFNEGLRALGIYLKGEIDRADPEAFARMLGEKIEE